MKDFISYHQLHELDTESVGIVQQATEALALSYSPYSAFQVGTAILLTTGAIVRGANQENAAYPSCMCAERVALYTMSMQYPKAIIKKMAIVARSKNQQDLVPATACGACRQVMLEYEERQAIDYEVIMLVADRQWIIAPSAGSLLPFHFTGRNLTR